MPVVTYSETEHVDGIAMYSLVYGDFMILSTQIDRMMNKTTPKEEIEMFMRQYEAFTKRFVDLRQSAKRDELKERVLTRVIERLFDESDPARNLSSFFGKGTNLAYRLKKASE